MKKDYKLDSYEQEILDYFENEEWISILTADRKAEIEKMSKNTYKKICYFEL